MLQENLKKIRVTLGYSQQELADALNINVNTYRGYEYNKREMPFEILKILISKFRININWLLLNDGEMFIQSNKNTLKKILNDSIIKNTVYIGNKLSDIQETNNISNKEMSGILNIYEDEYIDLKQGKREPSFKILNCLKKSFDISIDWLLYGDC